VHKLHVQFNAVQKWHLLVCASREKELRSPGAAESLVLATETAFIRANRKGGTPMPSAVRLTRKRFQEDRQGRTFSDVLDDPGQPFDEVLAFFSDPARQRRMEESEIHHDRPALAGVVREFEAQPSINAFLSSAHPGRAKRLRQAVGVVVRIIMEQRGWKKAGRKGSLGVRGRIPEGIETPGIYHNTGGLALWFLRAERYQPVDGAPFRSVKERAEELEAASEEGSRVR
jgi:hypothetical protein